MNKMIVRLFTCIFLFFALPAFAGETITLAALDWEPYIGQKMKNQGYVAELVTEAYKQSGYSVQITYLPWARLVKMAEGGQFDGYFPEYFSESLKEHFIVSAAFPGGPLGFFKRKGEAISFKTLKDLTPYKIGVVRGYINTAEFDAANFLKKDEATDDLMNLNKLLKKRVDLVVCDKYVGLYTLKKELPNQVDALEFMSPPLEDKALYLCISKKAANRDLKLKAFNDGLKKLKDSGKVDAIRKKNGF